MQKVDRESLSLSIFYYLLRTCKVKTETIPGFALKSTVKYDVKISNNILGALPGVLGARVHLKIFEEKVLWALLYSSLV